MSSSSCQAVDFNLFNNFSSSKLSTKSLEMCTENLGSETGSDCSESSSKIHFTPSKHQLEDCELLTKHYKKCAVKKRTNRLSDGFPPPLSSISITGGVQLRPYRNGGRLVLIAESVPSDLEYFEAERSDGRLRLRLIKNYSSDYYHDEEKEEEEEEEEGYVDEIENKIEKIDLDVGGIEEENGVKVGSEMGPKKMSITGSCKEGECGRNRMPSWEHFLVAS